MPWFRTTGGVVMEIDVPAGGHALERHEEKLAKGELVPVAHAERVERVDLADGAYTWREVDPPAEQQTVEPDDPAAVETAVDEAPVRGRGGRTAKPKD